MTYAGLFDGDIHLRPDVMQGDPEWVLRHEFNHYFDWIYGNISQSPEWKAQSARATSVFGYHKSRHSPIERYALMGEYPWLFPQLRQFYPQYTDAAFSNDQHP